MPSTILTERDTNVKQPVAVPNTGDDKPNVKSMEYHRQVLESRLKEGKSVTSSHSSLDNNPQAAEAVQDFEITENQQTYISPSDTIQSPATQKLAAFKNKHIKAARPQSLFAKTASKNVDAATARNNTDLFADIPRQTGEKK
ncbi:hypothetical protein EJ08DRAFT_48109 [Tothia fuscella]|uniref:Uncharacterized protein n=1 Tax=Tothia fuscella TaxID=1048955 RepID=A0A9P4NFF0_9PEZI|nr:hypothetical protein EJ08DRAFT_48109 [Tothia fuscella]